MTTETLGTVLDDPVPRDAPIDPDGSDAVVEAAPDHAVDGSPRAALELLLAADVDTTDRESVAALVRRSQQLRGWLDAFDVHCVRRTNTLAEQGHSESGEAMIGRVGNRSSRDARMTRLRTETCDLFLLFEQALTAGDVSSGHVDALGLAIRDLTDDQRFGVIDREARLLGSARRMRVDDFSRHVRVQVADVVAELARMATPATSTETTTTETTTTETTTTETTTTETTTTDADAAQRGCGSAPIDDIGSATTVPEVPLNSPVLDPEVIEYERQRAGSKLRRWRDAESGMCMTMIALDPIRDAVFKKAFNAHLNQLRATGATSGKAWSEVEIDALMRLVAASVVAPNSTPSDRGTSENAEIAPASRSGMSAVRGAANVTVEALPTNSALSVPEFCAVISWDRLLDDACSHGLCETSDGQSIAPVSLRRMLCDAAVYPVVLASDGRVLDAGRTNRTVTPDQRAALRSMHRTCGHPVCEVPFDSCRIHHVRWWTRDLGPTDLDNLLPLCENHHHLVHEGGWALTMTADRVATWKRPDGTIWLTASTADRAIEALGFELEPRCRDDADPPTRPLARGRGDG